MCIKVLKTKQTSQKNTTLLQQTHKLHRSPIAAVRPRADDDDGGASGPDGGHARLSTTSPRRRTDHKDNTLLICYIPHT